MKRSLWMLALLVMASPATMAQDWWEENSADYAPISLEVNAWMNRLDGTLQWGTSSVPGKEMNFRDDNGLGSDTWGPYVRLNLGLSDRWTMRFSFWHIQTTGIAKPTKSLSFGGNTFAQGLDTSSDFSLDAYDILLGYKFIDGEQIDFSLLFGGGVFIPKMEMQNTANALSVERGIVPTPQVGLGMDVSLTKGLLFRSQIVGFALDCNDANGQQFDAEAAINATIFQGCYITAGYKFFKADVDFSNNTDSAAQGDKADFNLQGPFFGLGFVF